MIILRQKNYTWSEFGKAVKSIGIGAATGATIGFGPFKRQSKIGAAVGGAIGAGLGAGMYHELHKNRLKAKKKIEDLKKDLGDDLLGYLKGNLPKNYPDIVKLVDDLNKLKKDLTHRGTTGELSECYIWLKSINFDNDSDLSDYLQSYELHKDEIPIIEVGVTSFGDCIDSSYVVYNIKLGKFYSRLYHQKDKEIKLGSYLLEYLNFIKGVTKDGIDNEKDCSPYDDPKLDEDYKTWLSEYYEKAKNLIKQSIILRQKQFTYEDDDLEAYEDLDPKKIAKLTDNQKRMLLEDERKKAKRNRSRVIQKYGEEGERKGRKEGKKKGTKRGAIAGGITGALVGGVIGHEVNYDFNDSKKNIRRAGIGSLIGAGLGAGGGALLGREAGGESGAAKGRAAGEAKGRKIAKEQGHDDIDRTTKNARILDDYARTHKGRDDWEIGFRNQLKKEKKEREEAAERKRQAELERRRVEAEEERAKAEREKARTDRDRYVDEHFGWGQYGRKSKKDNNDYDWDW